MSWKDSCAVARVYLLDTLYHIDKLYDYYIPEPLRGQIEVGGFVVVPFGRTTRKFIALVAELCEESELAKLKPILSTINPGLVLDDEQRKLCAYIKDHTFCTMGDAVRAMLPTAAFSALMMTYAPDPDGESRLASQENDAVSVYHYIAKLKTATESRLVQHFGERVRELLRDMVRENLIRELPAGMGTEEKTVSMYRLCVSDETAAQMLSDGALKGEKQAELLRMLLENGTLAGSDLRQNGISGATCQTLIKRGLIEKEELPAVRDPFADVDSAAPEDQPMTEEQTRAFESIKALLDTGKPKAALLYGVTGSGKTRVMKAVIDEVIARGRTVILLVPEIALTPQTVRYFRSYYGSRTAVIHSMLSAGERYDAWRRMKNGEIVLCIGTRSAVFAPMQNLGAILIDEEQEHTYKSDSAPKYHAIDVARFRCAYHNALMLPASATPSLESYYKAEQGAYTLVTLENRYGSAELPRVHLADMRESVSRGELSPIGSELKQRLHETLEKGQQAILFINRRGYHRFLTCPLCGEVVRCPRCSVSLTHHAVRGNAAGGLLRCHYCGHQEAVMQICPSCGKPGLRHVGFGTQKAEEELHALFPEARILRMDADTTVGKMAYRSILEQFRSGQADILLGTQMVTKGHDFPKVTTVGVLSADGALYLDDYRAAERTFSLLTQVVGRAGRGKQAGEALIQTMSPHHPMLALVKEQDYPAFYRQEIVLRRALSFPPFCDLVSVTVSGKEEVEVAKVAASFAQAMEAACRENSDLPIQTFGPMEAPVYRLNEVYRMRLVIKCVLNQRTRTLLSDLLKACSGSFARRVSITLDPNPSSI